MTGKVSNIITREYLKNAFSRWIFEYFHHTEILQDLFNFTCSLLVTPLNELSPGVVGIGETVNAVVP